MNERAPTKRFSERVALYVKYRPSYPTAVFHYLQAECGLTKTAVIADVGSGTGISSKLFLAQGHAVFGVEPNQEMREAGEKLLASYEQFTSVNGTAEATTLTTASVDWVVAGQAFHWFDAVRTQEEFARILRPGGKVLLMWNVQDDDKPLMGAYAALLKRYSIDYEQTTHKRKRKGDERAFLGERMKTAVLENVQQFDYEGFKGRALSSSYTPLPDHPNHLPFIEGLQQLFSRFAENGRVSFYYKTRLFIGEPAQIA